MLVGKGTLEWLLALAVCHCKSPQVQPLHTSPTHPFCADAECPPLARGDLRNLSVQRRLRYVTRALAYFKHWYSIPDAVKALLAPYAPEGDGRETPT
jgi:hypothetical protein